MANNNNNISYKSGLVVTDIKTPNGESSSFMTETLVDGGTSSVVNFPSAPPTGGLALGGSFSITQSSIFSNAEEAFDNIKTVNVSNLSALFNSKRPDSINGLQKSERIMCSKVLEKKAPSVVNPKRRRKFLESSRLIHHVKEKKRNQHPVTSYGGPVRKWPTKRRGKIAPLVYVRDDEDDLLNEYYDQNYVSKKGAGGGIYHKSISGYVGDGSYIIDNMVDGQNIYHGINKSKRFLSSSESNMSFLAGKPGSTASDFKHIQSAGGGDLLLRPWSQRKEDKKNSKQRTDGKVRKNKEKHDVYKKIPPYANPNHFRAISPVIFPIYGAGKASKAKMAHSLSSSIRPRSGHTNRTMSANSIAINEWNTHDLNAGDSISSVNNSIILPPEPPQSASSLKRSSLDSNGSFKPIVSNNKDNLLIVLMPKASPTINKSSMSPTSPN